MSAISSTSSSTSALSHTVKRRKVGPSSNPESRSSASVKRMSPNFLNLFYENIFLPIAPNKYVQVVQFDDAAVTVLSKIDTNTVPPTKKFAKITLNSPFDGYYSGDDQVLAYVPEKKAHFFGTIVSIDGEDINLNLDATDGRVVPYTIERTNKTALTNLERIIVVRGQDRLANIPFQVTKLEFADEEYPVRGYDLGVY